MKRFLFYLTMFLVAIAFFAVAIDQVNVALIRASSGNSAYKMERLFANPDSEEIAIVGSSRACGNFAPSVISPRCFDYGVNGMTMREIMLVLAVLQKRRTSAPVILNFDPWGGFGDHPFVANYVLAPQGGRVGWADRIPGVRFFGSLRGNLAGFIDSRRSVSRVIDNGAQLIKASRTPAEWAIINAKMTPEEFDGDDAEVEKFLALIRSFEPRRVFVVLCPCTAQWNSKFSGRSELGKILLAMKGIPNVTVLDFYTQTTVDDADFVDPKHFNVQGATRFSERIRAALDIQECH